MSTMSMTTPNFQGMDTLWQIAKPQIHNRHEAALAITHWMVISNGYHCVGRESQVGFAIEKKRRYPIQSINAETESPIHVYSSYVV